MKDLQGKTAVIIGSATGIGCATALNLAKQGTQVVMADIDEDVAAQVAKQAQQQGLAVVATACDVTQAGAFEKLKQFSAQTFGAVDIVMNNVGVLTCGNPEDIPLTEWERIINTNLMSVVRGVHTFMPAMVAQGSGHIINTASFAGLYPYAFDRLPYASTKAAIVAMSEGLALYLKPQGIGVTCLCPGPVKTEIAKTMKFWSEDIQLRGPGSEYEMMESEVVGAMVVDAIKNDQFLLLTHPQLVSTLEQRAANFDAFIDNQIDVINSEKIKTKVKNND